MNISSLPTKVDSNYPEIGKVMPNKEYISIIKNLYASCGSETTAILQYVYQHYVFSPFEPDIANILIHIAEVEMHHQELLGEVIVKLGGNPTFTGAYGEYWNAKCIKYSRNLKEALVDDIHDEEKAIEGYLAAAKCIKEKQISALMIRIAEDELVHKNDLEYMLMHLDSCGNNKKDSICSKDEV